MNLQPLGGLPGESGPSSAACLHLFTFLLLPFETSGSRSHPPQSSHFSYLASAMPGFGYGFRLAPGNTYPGMGVLQLDLQLWAAS